MKLTLNIRPVRVTATTRARVMSTIQGGHCVAMGSQGSYLAPYPGHNRDTVRVYNLEKRRKRVEITVHPRTKKVGRSVVSPAHWVGHYYDIPVEFLRLGRLRVRQLTRHFEITGGSL
jgi:hypothetical protein